MGRELQFNSDNVTLKLTGFTGVFALKFELPMPYSSIHDVVVEDFEAPLWMLRLPGTSIAPLHVFEGSFLYQEEWYFLSYERRVPLVKIELEEHEKYRYVIFQMDHPTEAAANIRRHVREYRERHK